MLVYQRVLFLLKKIICSPTARLIHGLGMGCPAMSGAQKLLTRWDFLGLGLVDVTLW
jgi:hypothetical protein